MKNPKFYFVLISVIFLIISNLYAQDSTAKKTAKKMGKTTAISTVSFQAKPSLAQNDKILDEISSWNSDLNNCNAATFAQIVDKRNALVGNLDAISENYQRAKALILFDNELLNCVKRFSVPIIDTIIIHDNNNQTELSNYRDRINSTRIELSDCQNKIIIKDSLLSDCQNKIIYISVGAGAAIILLLISLLNALKAKKWMEEIFNKLHDKILDYFTDKLIAAIGFDDDGKLKKKIKKLKELNKNRKRKYISVENYLLEVDGILKD